MGQSIFFEQVCPQAGPQTIPHLSGFPHFHTIFLSFLFVDEFREICFLREVGDDDRPEITSIQLKFCQEWGFPLGCVLQGKIFLQIRTNFEFAQIPSWGQSRPCAPAMIDSCHSERQGLLILGSIQELRTAWRDREWSRILFKTSLAELSQVYLLEPHFGWG